MGQGRTVTSSSIRNKDIKQMATFNITNPASAMDMNSAYRIMEKYNGLAKSCRFFVRINQIDKIQTSRARVAARDFEYLCETTDLPGRGFVSADIRYYGPNFKMPVQTQYEDINFTFLCRNKSLEREFFDDWMDYMNPNTSFDFKYRDQYSTSIDIFQISEYPDASVEADIPGTVRDIGKAEYKLTLHNAYPILLNAQPLNWSDFNYLRLVVSFTYTHWGREKDRARQTFNLLTDARDVLDERGRINESVANPFPGRSPGTVI